MDECPSADPILIAVATVTNAPMPNITVPGINIASLSPPADMDPMMKSGKPMLNKITPRTALLLEEGGALDLNPIFKSVPKAPTKINPPIPMNMAPGMSIPRTSFFSSF